jgi:dihydroneopterin aldolase
LFENVGAESAFTPSTIKDSVLYGEICETVKEKIKTQKNIQIEEAKVFKVLKSMLMVYTGYIDTVNHNKR